MAILVPGTPKGRYCVGANQMPSFRLLIVVKAGVAASTLPAAQTAQKKLGAGGESGQADAYQPESEQLADYDEQQPRGVGR